MLILIISETLSHGIRAGAKVACIPLLTEIDQPGKGPKAFSKVSWGKIANIGGEQVSPIGMETIDRKSTRLNSSHT